MNELDRGFRRALELDDERDDRSRRKAAMNPLPSWRRCPKCGAVEIYTGTPKFDPDTVFIRFLPIRHMAGTGIPTALQCPKCAHIVDMQ